MLNASGIWDFIFYYLFFPTASLEVQGLCFTCAFRKFQRFNIYPIFNEFSQGGKTQLTYLIPHISWSNGCWTLVTVIKLIFYFNCF